MSDYLAFVDTETTGLNPSYHEIWEVGLIVRDDGVDTEYTWQLPVDLNRADPKALEIGRFHERYDLTALTPRWRFAKEFLGHFEERQEWIVSNAYQTVRRHLVGAVPSFDDERLRLLLASFQHPQDSAGWHYHLIDVEALAVGYLAGRVVQSRAHDGPSATHQQAVSLPWNSKDLSRAVGVDPKQFDAHTALGDARWARAIYDAIMQP